jgi:hypothetical protein
MAGAIFTGMKRCVRGYGLLAALLLCCAMTARAVIFHSTGDPTHNTTAPTGALTNSGWQFQGRWGGFLGTPIAPRFFLAAKHVGGSVGETFHYRGVGYVTTAFYDDPAGDLRLWAVCGTFPEVAPLYAGTNEVGKTAVIFGRGTQRGVAVTVSNGDTNELKGWQWGAFDSVQRWGTNVITAVETSDPDDMAGSSLGNFLACTFDADGGDDEAHLSSGDSSGGFFIQDDGVWKLAGINYAVDGPFNSETNGPGFFAVLFDQGGLHTNDGTNWVLTPNTTTNVPSRLYVTRVSEHLPWINSVLSGPPPPESPPRILMATNLSGPFSLVTDALVDHSAKTVRLPAAGEMRFILMEGCSALRITNAQVNGTNLILKYQ